MSERQVREVIEGKILDALDLLTTTEDDNGVEINGSGPRDGSKTRVEGYYTNEAGQRFLVAADLTIELTFLDLDWEHEFGRGDE